MNLRRTLAFTRRSLLQFRHDRRTFAFLLIMPLLMILIFGYTFGGDVKNITVEVVNLDHGLPSGTNPLLPQGLFLANNITKNFDTDTFSIHETTNTDDARQQVHDGKAWAAIIFPANFTQNFLTLLATQQDANRPTVEIYLDASNPTISAAVIKTLSQSLQNTLKELTATLNTSHIDLPITITQTYAY